MNDQERSLAMQSYCAEVWTALQGLMFHMAEDAGEPEYRLQNWSSLSTPTQAMFMLGMHDLNQQSIALAMMVGQIERLSG